MLIRIAEPGDARPVLELFDAIVEWLVAQGRTGQWGTQSWSERPELVARIEGRVERGELRVAVEERDPETILGVLGVSEECGEYVSPPPEPELFVSLLGTARVAKGRDLGGLLLAEARAEARRRGLRLLRVDCYAGDDGKLAAWYLGQGFATVETFVVKREGRPDWPGMLLAEHLD